ncbi:hypothetical protein PMAYCL1PPCAC_13667 [Pristionchus mayeri]|uniref:Uncharacterized protein n=1 Tax=Pristionchus mayeri TaxID=1317129 RepID=A0AAN5CGI3_9BILA|nr:hypothetical protein PMAYCL1PPCAC_13667 [Pristionchus mayeri]
MITRMSIISIHANILLRIHDLQFIIQLRRSKSINKLTARTFQQATCARVRLPVRPGSYLRSSQSDQTRDARSHHGNRILLGLMPRKLDLIPLYEQFRKGMDGQGRGRERL